MKRRRCRSSGRHPIKRIYERKHTPIRTEELKQYLHDLTDPDKAFAQLEVMYPCLSCIVRLRLKYPAASLSQLGDMLSVTKQCIHRQLALAFERAPALLSLFNK